MQHHAHRLGRSAALSAAFAVGTVFLPLLGAGCADHPNADPNAVSPRHAGNTAAASGLVEASAIERSPAYRTAILSYRNMDYRCALGQIDGLLKTPKLSPAAQAFLQHQHDLCAAAASGRTLATSSNTASAAAAQPRHRPVRSATNADCGPRALLLVCQNLKIPARLDALRKVAGTTADGTSIAGLVKAAHSVGLKADGVQMDRNALSNLSKPAVSWTDGNHYIAVLAVHHSLMNPVNGDTVIVHDPNNQREEEMPLDGPTGLLAKSGGMVLLLSRENKLAAAEP